MNLKWEPVTLSSVLSCRVRMGFFDDLGEHHIHVFIGKVRKDPVRVGPYLHYIGYLEEWVEGEKVAEYKGKSHYTQEEAMIEVHKEIHHQIEEWYKVFDLEVLPNFYSSVVDGEMKDLIREGLYDEIKESDNMEI